MAGAPFAEPIEGDRPLLLRDADAGILNGKMQGNLFRLLLRHGDGNAHFPFIGILDGIADEIVQYLANADHIRNDSFWECSCRLLSTPVPLHRPGI